MPVPTTTQQMAQEALENADGSSSVMAFGSWLDCNELNSGEFVWRYHSKYITEERAAELLATRPEKGRAR